MKIMNSESKTEDVEERLAVDHKRATLEAFKDEIRAVYHEVDRLSALLWSHDDTLVRSKRRSIKSDSKNEDEKWKKESNAQLGYGEITKGSLQDFILILQNIDLLFREEDESYLLYNKEDYWLTSKSTFIDIGSGFGKPVFHAAMQVGWKSKGVEIVPARVNFWIDYVFEYEEKRKFRIKNEDKRLEELEAKNAKALLTPSKQKWQPKSATPITCNPLAIDNDESTVVETKVSPFSIKSNLPIPTEERTNDTDVSKQKSGIEEAKDQLPTTKQKSLKRTHDEMILLDNTIETRLKNLNLKLEPNYSILWFRNVSFQQCDAGKVHKLEMKNNAGETSDITHIYSYNKVMGKEWLEGIAQALNNTDFKILAWYVNEKSTYNLVKNVKLLFKRPMQSTGNEKFSVYVYYKTNGNEVKTPSNNSDDSNDFKISFKETDDGYVIKNKRAKLV